MERNSHLSVSVWVLQVCEVYYCLSLRYSYSWSGSRTASETALKTLRLILIPFGIRIPFGSTAWPNTKVHSATMLNNESSDILPYLMWALPCAYIKQCAEWQFSNIREITSRIGSMQGYSRSLCPGKHPIRLTSIVVFARAYGFLRVWK